MISAFDDESKYMPIDPTRVARWQGMLDALRSASTADEKTRARAQIADEVTSDPVSRALAANIGHLLPVTRLLALLEESSIRQRRYPNVRAWLLLAGVTWCARVVLGAPGAAWLGLDGSKLRQLPPPIWRVVRQIDRLRGSSSAASADVASVGLSTGAPVGVVANADSHSHTAGHGT